MTVFPGPAGRWPQQDGDDPGEGPSTGDPRAAQSPGAGCLPGSPAESRRLGAGGREPPDGLGEAPSGDRMTPGAAVREWNGLGGLSRGPSELAVPGLALPGDTGLGAWARGDHMGGGLGVAPSLCLHADLGHTAAPQAREGDPGGHWRARGDWPPPLAGPPPDWARLPCPSAGVTSLNAGPRPRWPLGSEQQAHRPSGWPHGPHSLTPVHVCTHVCTRLPSRGRACVSCTASACCLRLGSLPTCLGLSPLLGLSQAPLGTGGVRPSHPQPQVKGPQTPGRTKVAPHWEAGRVKGH